MLSNSKRRAYVPRAHPLRWQAVSRLLPGLLATPQASCESECLLNTVMLREAKGTGRARVCVLWTHAPDGSHTLLLAAVRTRR
eukprot:4083345-Prymnesium_polylepis.1